MITSLVIAASIAIQGQRISHAVDSVEASFVACSPDKLIESDPLLHILANRTPKIGLLQLEKRLPDSLSFPPKLSSEETTELLQAIVDHSLLPDKGTLKGVVEVCLLPNGSESFVTEGDIYYSEFSQDYRFNLDHRHTFDLSDIASITSSPKKLELRTHEGKSLIQKSKFQYHSPTVYRRELVSSFELRIHDSLSYRKVAYLFTTAVLPAKQGKKITVTTSSGVESIVITFHD